jgi:hypothetical protein
MQDIGPICRDFPRLPDDIEVIRVVKHYKLGDNDVGTKAFFVRKTVVLNALQWLKTYNNVYKDINIDENRLNWIENGVEQELPMNVLTDNTKDDVSFWIHFPYWKYYPKLCVMKLPYVY